MNLLWPTEHDDEHNTTHVSYQLVWQRRLLCEFQQGGFKGANLESAMLSVSAEMPDSKEEIEDNERYATNAQMHLESRLH